MVSSASRAAVVRAVVVALTTSATGAARQALVWSSRNGFSSRGVCVRADEPLTTRPRAPRPDRRRPTPAPHPHRQDPRGSAPPSPEAHRSRAQQATAYAYLSLSVSRRVPGGRRGRFGRPSNCRRPARRPPKLRSKEVACRVAGTPEHAGTRRTTTGGREPEHATEAPGRAGSRNIREASTGTSQPEHRRDLGLTLLRLATCRRLR